MTSQYYGSLRVHAHAQRLPSLKKHLAEASLQTLADIFELQTFDAGEVITMTGQVADRIFVIKSGGCVLTQVGSCASMPHPSLHRCIQRVIQMVPFLSRWKQRGTASPPGARRLVLSYDHGGYC